MSRTRLCFFAFCEQGPFFNLQKSCITNGPTTKQKAAFYKIAIKNPKKFPPCQNSTEIPTPPDSTGLFFTILTFLGVWYIFGRMTRRGTPPKTLTKRGTRIFVDGEVFDVHVVVGITPTAQRDVCASTVHCSSYIHHHCLRTAERLTACGASVQALSSLKRQTSWYPVLTGNISKKSHIVI